MNDTQAIKDAIDVVDLIGEYVQLKPAGTNHKGLCPFHREKSPSFMANRERQSWHCFGCAKGGDIFTFVQEIEGMEFVEALRFLATRAGIELTGRERNDIEQNQKNRLKDINAKAAYFYHNFFLQMEGAEPARKYLLDRGLTDETILEWQIGFVPDQWDLLTKYLLKKGCAIDDMVASGLTIQREGASGTSGRGYYDRFRGRIMFPIRDMHGDVVGFTGRVLVETETSGGKYVNTPQTPIFDKSRIVFALDKSRQAIKQAGYSVMVEGQMDVIACHQAGMHQVVASSGTAMTEHQVKVLERYAKSIRMAFDADEAGQAAAKRGIDIAIEAGLEVKIIQIPEGAGKDPDECLKKNKDTWFKAVDDAVDVMRWYFDRAFLNRDILNPKHKQAIANELLAEIARIPFSVEQDHWVQELSHLLRVDAPVLRDDLKRIQTGRHAAANHTVKSVDPAIAPVIRKAEVTRLDRLATQLIMLIIRYPATATSFWTQLPDKALSTSVHAALYETLKLAYSTNGKIDIDQVRHALLPSLQHDLDVLLMKAESDVFAFLRDDAKAVEREYLLVIEQVRAAYVHERRQELQVQLEIAEKQGQTDRISHILTELQSLS